VKYPVRPISNAILLRKKMNDLNQKVRIILPKHLNSKINAYRQVRGDGNCFFRAFAFSYITNRKVIYHDDLFTYLKNVSLLTCNPKSIPKQFGPFYKDEILKGIIEEYW